MTVSFDATTSRLRLDADHFIALAAHTADPSAAPLEAVRRLEEAGVLSAGRPHQALRPGLAAVSSPMATLQVLVAGIDGTHLHSGWLSIVSAMLADLGDTTYDFVGLGTEFVPTAVARLTRLRSRPRLDDDVVRIGEHVFDELSSNSLAARRRAAATLACLTGCWEGLSERVRADDWHLAVVDVAVQSRGRTETRHLAFIDTGAGLLRIEGDEQGPLLVPTTSTALWRALVSILPTDDDLGLSTLVA